MKPYQQCHRMYCCDLHASFPGAGIPTGNGRQSYDYFEFPLGIEDILMTILSLKWEFLDW